MEKRATPSRRHWLARALALTGALCATAVPAMAQDNYPSKPIRIVVGFAAGGAADALTRIIATQLSKQMGQQVIVENRPGAEGILSVQAVMSAPPDGYTFMMGSNTALVAVPSMRPNPPYDPFKALTPISAAGQFSKFLVVPTNFPAKDIKEFLAVVRANPDKFSSASSNSAAELAMIQLLAPTRVLNVRYKGDVPALTDMAAGQGDMIFTTGTTAPTFVANGRVRALLTLQPTRSPLLPDVPTALESGLGNNLTINPWAGFFGPAGMPPAIVQRLSKELQAALKSPEVRDKLALQGFAAQGSSPEEFSKFFRATYDDFVRIVRENNVKFD